MKSPVMGLLLWLEVISLVTVIGSVTYAHARENEYNIHEGSEQFCYRTAVKETMHSCHVMNNGPMSVELSHGIPQDALCVTTNGMCFYCDLGTLRETDCRSGRGLNRKKRFIIGLIVGLIVAAAAVIVAVALKPQPPPPVNKSPTITCPHVSDKTAPSLKTSVKVSWSLPTVKDDSDHFRIKQISGKESSSYFDKGSHVVEYKVTDSGGRRDYCTISFSVRVIKCFKTLSSPSNGGKTCNTYDNIYGRKCYFYCYSGFWLDGSSSSTCQRNGRYSKSTPKCRRKTCSALSFPNFGHSRYCTNGRYYESVCFLGCNKSLGYEPISGSHAKCQANKVWKKWNWKCEDTMKPEILNCPEGELRTANMNFRWPTIRAKDNSNKVNLTQKLDRHPGSSLNEVVKIIRYTAVDPSGNEAEPCVFSVKFELPSCGPPPSPSSEEAPYFNCSDYSIGEYCKAVCNHTRVVGADYIKCARTGGVIPTSDWVEYNGSFPTCFRESKICPDLKAPVNGALVCFHGGTFCLMQCNEDYDIPKVMVRKTTSICSDSEWSPKDAFPDCTALSVPGVFSLPSKLYSYFYGYCTDSETIEEIRNNFLGVMYESEIFDCSEDKCPTENINVTCGPVDDVEDEFSSGEDLVFNRILRFGDESEDKPKFPFRRRRDVKELPLPTGIWNRSEYTFGVNDNITTAESHVTDKEVTRYDGTDPHGREGSGDGSGEAIDGSGEMEEVRNLPLSRAVISLEWEIRNSLRLVTENMMKVFVNEVLNNTRMSMKGTPLENIEIGSYGNFTFSCGPGRVVASSSPAMCVECPRGRFHNQIKDSCDLCPVNTFSNSTGQTLCSPCGHLLGTKTNGSLTSEACISMCAPGHYSTTGLTPCKPCPLGTVQTKPNGKICSACPGDSSTLERGSSQWNQCIQFDTIANGPVQMKFGPVITGWIEEVTLTFWIRVLQFEEKNPNISLTFDHPSQGQLMTLMLSREINARMKEDKALRSHFLSEAYNCRSVMMALEMGPTGPISNAIITLRQSLANGSCQRTAEISEDIIFGKHRNNLQLGAEVPLDKWTHIAMAWKGYPTSVNIYKAGRTVGYFSGFSPLCFLPVGTELTMNIADGTGVMLRELYVIPFSNTSRMISDMAASCSARTGYESLITKAVPSDTSKVSLVIPSVCSELDRCSPSPCPGHYCKSLKHGFLCTCRGGFSGLTCSTPPDYCVVDNKCQHDAICENVEGGVNCTCTENYKGEYCQIPIVHGNWGIWSAWSLCSVSCGGGQRSRTRECNDPLPEPDLGRPCTGVKTEESMCNMMRCPECKSSQLTAGRGAIINCTRKSLGSMNCSVACEEGLVPQEVPPSYICHNELWVPSTRTISCVEVQIPDDIGFRYTIPYKTEVDGNEHEDLLAIRQKMDACASHTHCLKKKECSFLVTTETCRRSTGGCSEFPEGYKATLKFTFDMVVDNTSAEITTKNIEGAWISMNSTYNDLQAMYDECFPVQLSVGIVPPGTVGVGSYLTCEKGFVPNQGYCSACAPGTREKNGVCLQCEYGWYQEESGQRKCDVCPTAYWTHFLGSIIQSECNAPPADAFMLLTDSVDGYVWSVNMSDFAKESVPIPDGIKIGSSSYDPVTKHFIYVDKGTPAIHSIGPKKSMTYLTLDYVADVRDITIDPVSRLIFYTDSGNDVIGVVSMATKQHKIVIKDGSSIPGSIALDALNGVLYWIDWGRYQKIERANYDGTDRMVLLQSLSAWPEGLTLDTEGKRLYWNDIIAKSVEVMDFDGRNRKTLITSDGNPSSITLFQNYLFYSAVNTNDSIIMRMNKDGTGLVKTELSPFHYLSDMNVHRKNDSHTVSNGCSLQNGGCSHLCFPKPNGNRICACAEGYSKNQNGVNCTKSAEQSVWNFWM